MKARELSDVYDIFDPQEALKGEKLNEYYVKRESPIDRIGNALRKSKKPLKYLLVGSRGNGKSTELNRLAVSLEGDLLVVPFSIKEKLNLYDVEYTDILLVIAAEIFKTAHDAGVLFSKDLEGLLDRWTERIVEDIKERGMGGELGTGFSWFMANITGKLRAE
ncbi:MAG: hypothetical protein JW986_06940, partial [Methanotrichaceae archaeon]|nr:hypothetical protein [Methanotrichaceae archaeon]